MRCPVKGYRVMLSIALVAVVWLCMVLNTSGHRIPLSTNLGFTGVILVLILMIVFTQRIIR